MPSILFICTANQIRSPFAAAYFEKLLGEHKAADKDSWQVASAGTWADPGLPADFQLKNFAQNWGLNFHSHRTRQVEKNLLDSQDLVLAMEKGQREALIYEFPQNAEKIKLLTDFCGPAYDIDDPQGLGIQQYEKCLEEIARVLSSAFIEITRAATNN